MQKRKGINGAKQLKTQRQIQGRVDQRPRAESPQMPGSSEQEESVCVSWGLGLSPGAEGGTPRVCGRAGVGGEGHTPCGGRICLPTEQVCLGSTPLPGGRHPQMDGGSTWSWTWRLSWGQTPAPPHIESRGHRDGPVRGCGHKTRAIPVRDSQMRARHEGVRRGVWKSSWEHEPRDPRPVRRKQDCGPLERQSNTNKTHSARAPPQH